MTSGWKKRVKAFITAAATGLVIYACLFVFGALDNGAPKALLLFVAAVVVLVVFDEIITALLFGERRRD